jgi:signal transduction histidine kinase
MGDATETRSSIDIFLAKALRRPWPAAVLVIGVVAEVLVLVPFSVFEHRGNFVGSLAALPVAIACVAGFFGGPRSAAVVGLSGWAFFFALVTGWSLYGLIAMPLWVGTGMFVGLLSDRLRRREHELALLEVERRFTGLRQDLANQAHHEVRTPATVIYGMADLLMRDDLQLTTAQKTKFLELIAESAERLGDVPGRLEHHQDESLGDDVLGVPAGRSS